jgi:hypothetical protein
MAVTHEVKQVHPADTNFGGANPPYAGLEWRSSHKPEYHIYLFNVSPRTFDPNTNTGFAAGKLGPKGILVPGVEEGDPWVKGMDENQKYRFVTSFPQPILLSKPNLESNKIDYVEMDVRRYVIDLINPDNLSLTLDTQIAPDQVFSVGNDYSKRGIFFDYTNPPSRAATAKAIARMEAYFKNLLDIAAQLEMTDKPKLAQELTSNPDYAVAANYFGKDVPWNRIQVRPVLCPNCGEPKPAGRKFHMASFGTLCVEPTVEAWRAAVNAGVRRVEDVPDDFRWKGPTPPPPQPEQNEAV